ncbi:MAG: High-affinity nickel-transporter [Actinobacteria bacterium]|nr:High-affinity nickel-transporter [Actinomycetota bacterium]
MRRILVFALAGTFVLIALAPAASAHPLGNFTINHYDGLRLEPKRITDMAVIDSAEIPTAQATARVDANGDGQESPAERGTYAAQQCDALAGAVQVAINGSRSQFTVASSRFAYRPGAAGLRVSRLVCELTAPVNLAKLSAVTFNDSFASDRVGWHEVTAVGQGVELRRSPVPQRSISDALLHYPNDLLSSPLDVRTATISAMPGVGASTVSPGAGLVPRAGLIARMVDGVNNSFNTLVGRRHLTIGIMLTAIGLAMLLGASHAVMPGHGKTVMAAYIAGRQGSVRDAFVVGATVTATHTAGVLVLGIALSVSASLAGEAVLQWLGVASGLIVAGVGAGLLLNALRQRHHDARDHHVHAHAVALAPQRVLVGAGGPPTGEEPARHGHTHPHPHLHGHSHPHEQRGRRTSRRGLVGMGIAGGLVPSPSALVVLLAAIALGRAVFGVVLVVGYGIGMAATLTAAGLLLVKVRDRYQARPADSRGRLGRFGERWIAILPISTACVVMVVGLGLAARGLGLV